MALKKTIASHVKEIIVMVPMMDTDGNFLTNEDGSPKMHAQKEVIEIPQVDVEMHPIEEAEILAAWETGDIERRMPKPFTKEQEHEWLLEFGADFVKNKRKEFNDLIDSFRPEMEQAHNKQQEASTKYQEWMSGDGDRWHKELFDNHAKQHIDMHVAKINENINQMVSSLKAQAEERRKAKELEDKGKENAA